MSKKFTGLCIYAKQELCDNELIQFIASTEINFQTTGCKGGVAAILLIYGMSFLFLSCHFPAKPVSKRRECY